MSTMVHSVMWFACYKLELHLLLGSLEGLVFAVALWVDESSRSSSISVFWSLLLVFITLSVADVCCVVGGIQLSVEFRKGVCNAWT